jgi:uncharacterized protein (TIGR02145 family)
MKKRSFTNIVIGIISLYACLAWLPLSAQNVGINTSGATPNAKAILDVDVSASSTKMGLLVPRMTTTERNSITAPIPESLLIYNLTTQCFEAWNQASGAWVTFGCIGCTIPGPTTANAATGTGTSAFTANWTMAPGATAYLLDVSTSSAFATFVSGYNGLNVGAATSAIVGGLSCGTTYYFRIRAMNTCGASANSNTVTAVTLNCPIPTVSACGTQVWAAANLNTGTMITGASSQTNNGIVEKYCYNDLPANCTTYGGLYQWNEMMNYTSTMNCDPCGSSGRQGICPTGFHVPTDLEWSRYEFCVESTIAPTGTVSLTDFQTTSGYRGTLSGDKLKVTAGNTPAWDGSNTSGFGALPAGSRNTGGSFINMSNNVYYWAATEASASDGWNRYLAAGVSQSRRFINDKTYGSAVRCLQD